MIKIQKLRIQRERTAAQDRGLDSENGGSHFLCRGLKRFCAAVQFSRSPKIKSAVFGLFKTFFTYQNTRNALKHQGGAMGSPKEA